MHQVWIAEDALRLGATGLDAKMLLGWNTIRLIAITTTTRKESFQHWDTANRKVEVVTRRVTTYIEEFAECLADVFALQPHGEVLAVRLMSRELNYSEALGDMTPDALVDSDARMNRFRVLVSSIAARATQVYVPPESQAILTNAARGSARTRLTHRFWRCVVFESGRRDRGHRPCACILLRA